MAKTKIKVDKAFAEEELKTQIEKGKELLEIGKNLFASFLQIPRRVPVAVITLGTL